VSADLIGALRLIHSVTGFLVRLTPAQLKDVAEGRLQLSVGAAVESHAPVATQKAPEAPRLTPVPEDQFAEIAAMLRKQETVNDAISYLKSVRIGGKPISRAQLADVAGQVGLTMGRSGTTKPNAIDRIVRHVIGNRVQYEGLRP
jgi:hypothetical protein